MEPSSWFHTYSLFVGFSVCFLSISGVIANALSVAVFLRANFRHLSINILLMALSFFDLCFLLLAIPVFMPPVVVEFIGAYMAYKIHVLTAACLYPVSIMFHCGSIWLLMVVTLERWLAVSRPFAVGYYCTKKRAYIAIFTTAFLAISCNLVRFWEYRLQLNDNGSITTEILLAQNKYYQLWYVTVASQLGIYVIPLIVLISFNFLISSELSKAIETRSQMSSYQTDDRKTAKMMRDVVIVFICCYSMSLILQLSESFIPNLLDSNLGYALSDLNNLLVVTNAATTSIFYLKFSSRYRSAVHLILCRIFSPIRYHHYHSTTTTPSRTYSCPNSELISRAATRASSLASQRTRHLSFTPSIEQEEKNILNPLSSPNRRRSYNDQRDVSTRNTEVFRERSRTTNECISVTVSVHCQVTQV